VLLNLVGNAVKFTDAGGVTVTADRTAGPALTFAVRDTGVGVPADRQAAIFLPFEQADGSTARRHGGTGLGLAIADRIVRRMGGVIHVDSLPGRGSTFTFTVPVAIAPEMAGGNEVVAGVACRPLRVLLAEDVAVNRRVAREILTAAGHTVVEASDGPSAVAAAASDEFDVILMDLQLPGLDGLDAAAAIRAAEAPRGRRTPVVALTARARPEDAAACRRAGFDGFVTKPAGPDVLLAALARAGGPVLDDRADILARVGGRPDLLDEVARVIAEDAARLASELREAADPATVARTAHRLAGLLGTVSRRGAEAAGRLAHDGTDAKARADLEAMLAALPAGLEGLRGVNPPGPGPTP
jgi:CheY-like chemotaxis protein